MLWAAVDAGAERLRELAAVAEAAARAAGFPPAGKRFTPHLTLGRMEPPRDVSAALARVPPLEVETRVGELTVFRSHLGRGPARYQAVARFGLE